MQKFITNLWYDTQAEEAAKFYTELFDNSRILFKTYYTPSSAEISGKPNGSVLTVEFELGGQRFTAINGGPQFNFTEAISILINCDTQEEIDRLWDALGKDGGQPGPCGWIKDKFGVSWQVVPSALEKMTADPDTEKAERAIAAMLKMEKLDAAKLERAYNGEDV